MDLEEIYSEYGNIYDYIKYELLPDGKYNESIELMKHEGTPYDLDYNFLEIDIYYQFAHEEYENQRFETALKYYLYVAERLPKWAKIYNEIGCTYDALEQTDKAIENLNKSIQLSDNTFAGAYYNLGYVYYKQGQNDEAKKYYDCACKLEPESGFKYYK